MAKINILFCVIALLCPFLVFATGTGNSEDVNKILQFMKGDGAIEKWFLDSFARMDADISSLASSGAVMGTSIGAMGALMYLGYLGWEMQEGARPWELTPMLRPIFLGFILTNWLSFTDLIRYPLQKLAEPSVSMFSEIEKGANDLRVKRHQLQLTLIDKAIELEAKQKMEEDKAKEGEEDKGWFEDMSDSASQMFDKIILSIKEFALKTQASVQILWAELFEAVALTVLRACVYGIFGIQKLWSYILIVLGPIAVGLALIPGFEGSFYNWVAKFININLYTFVAFTSMSIGNILITSGYEREIERYNTILNGGDEVIQQNVAFFIEGSGFIHIVTITVVSYFVTAVMVLMTPTIADSIVSAGGAGIASKMKQAAATAMSPAKAMAAGLNNLKNSHMKNKANKADRADRQAKHQQLIDAIKNK